LDSKFDSSVLTQAHVAKSIKEAKVQLQQSDGEYGPIQTVQMLQLAGDFFTNKTVEGNLVIPPVHLLCRQARASLFFGLKISSILSTHTRTEKMLVCLGGPIQGTFICSDAQLETESRGQDGCFLVKLPSPDSTISFEVSGCQRGVLASDPIRHPRARANFGVCVGLQKTTFGGDADFRVRACRDD